MMALQGRQDAAFANSVNTKTKIRTQKSGALFSSAR